MDLAERPNVDQGTIGRWECGIEAPLPSAAAALSALILRDDDPRAWTRYRTQMKHSPRPVCLVDRQAHLAAVNARSIEACRRNYGLDLTAHIGLHWARHAERLSTESSWEVFRDSGSLRGGLLMMRVFVNVRSKGHIIDYEPICEMGELAGFATVVVGSVDLPANSEMRVERAEVVHADAPDQMFNIQLGRFAAFTGPD